MKQSRHIQIALLSSIVSVVLCLMVLVGTTLAWFTDTVANKNTLKTGSIKAVFRLANGLVNGETQVLQTTSWEPGTEEIVSFEVSAQEGSMPFTYSIWLKSDAPTGTLARYLELYQVAEDETETPLGSVAENLNTPVVSGQSAETAATVSLKIKMNDVPLLLAGQAQNLWFELRAEQQRQPVSGAEDLRSQIIGGGYLQLGADVALKQDAQGTVSPLTVTKDTALDLKDQTLSMEGTANDVLLKVEEGAFLTLDAGAGGSLNAGDGLGVQVDGTVMVNGGSYTGATALKISGTAIINGGTFRPAEGTQAAQLIESESGAVLQICGGTFINFNPTKWVVGDHSVGAQTYGDEIWYIVS